MSLGILTELDEKGLCVERVKRCGWYDEACRAFGVYHHAQEELWRQSQEKAKRFELHRIYI